MIEIKRQFVEVLAQRLAEPAQFVHIVTGPRQVGKSTGVRRLLSDMATPSLYVSADQTTPPTASWLDEQWRRARALGVGAVLVVDEVQKIDRWSEVVKARFDEDRPTGRLKVVLLGSSSLALQRGLSDSLAGRFEILKVPHWSLPEMQSAFGVSFNEYLQFGGYPAFAPSHLRAEPNRWQALIQGSLIEPVISRDILELTPIQKPALFRQTFEFCMMFPAQVVGYAKLLGQLQDSGNATTIRHYLEVLENAFLIKLLNKFSGSKLRQRVSSPKILPLAPALLHAYSPPGRIESDATWRGRVIEMVAGAHLSKARGQLYYWSEGDYEIDYVLKQDERIYGIEIKSGLPRRSASMGRFLKGYPDAIPITIEGDGVEQLLLEDPSEFPRSVL